jgi:cell division septation protein DedD
MRLPTVLTVVALLGLFGASVYVGYIIGGGFMVPKQTASPPAVSPPKVRSLEPARPSLAPSPPPIERPPAQDQIGPPAPPKQEARLYRVQVGAFLRRENAEAMAARLRKDGYQPYISPTSPYKVQVGAFRERVNAERLAEELRAKGYEVYIAQ